MMARISYLVYAPGGGIGEGRRELFREYTDIPGTELLFWTDGEFDPGVKGARVLCGKDGVLEGMGRLLSESSGEYVVFLDLDSLIFPWMTVTLAGRLDENPGFGGAYGLQYGFAADSGTVAFVRGGPLSYFRLFERCPLGGGCAVLRRSAIEAAGGIRPFDGGESVGWDQFLYSRMALKSPWYFEPLPVGACYSREQRFRPFHAGKDSINTLVSLVNGMVSRNCRNWFSKEYGELMDNLCSGSIKAGDWKLPVLLVGLGVIYAAEGVGKSDAEAVLSVAERLKAGDWGVGISRVELCLSRNDYVAAWKYLEALSGEFGEDSYILRKILELKLRVMEKTGAPLETRREFGVMIRGFVDDAYYIRGEERQKIGKWLGCIFSAEDVNNV